MNRDKLIEEAIEIAKGYTTTTQEAHNPHDNVIVIYDEDIKGAVEAIADKILDRPSSEGGGSETTGGWVECSERLPEERQEVSVYFENLVGKHVTCAFWDGLQFVEMCERCNFKEGLPLNSVTHWQPLPTPPKGNKGEASE